VLFSKLFPVISIWETEKEQKERSEKPSRLQGEAKNPSSS
jgi:hypothetical protein